MKNYYSILGVTPDSTEAEIKAAYRSLARKYHPDINPAGSALFKDITEAYETLSDSKKKLHYDTINGFFKTSKKEEKQYTSSEKAKEEYVKSKAEEPKKKNEKKSDISKNLNDIFKDFGKTKKKKEAPKNGDDINEEVLITIKDAIQGTNRIINVLHASTCPHCKGRKFINGAECPVCNSSGEKVEHKKITVKIPAGIKNGTKLRIANEGQRGINGGKNGNLYITVKIQTNSRMNFENNDIIYNVPITPYEAALGATISIPSYDGNISLKIPPKTNSGQKFRLAGQGIKKNGKTGDMIVVVNIEFSSSLSDDEIRLYEKLKKMSSKDIRENLLNE